MKEINNPSSSPSTHPKQYPPKLGIVSLIIVVLLSACGGDRVPKPELGQSADVLVENLNQLYGYHFKANPDGTGYTDLPTLRPLPEGNALIVTPEGAVGLLSSFDAGGAEEATKAFDDLLRRVGVPYELRERDLIDWLNSDAASKAITEGIATHESGSYTFVLTAGRWGTQLTVSLTGK
ncbi:MAG TPA: hypothetical protein VJZ78_03520 [Anaerolineales bacterium]|nr:hypothetical protein [Anaerolineales bacterium]